MPFPHLPPARDAPWQAIFWYIQSASEESVRVEQKSRGSAWYKPHVCRVAISRDFFVDSRLRGAAYICWPRAQPHWRISSVLVKLLIGPLLLSGQENSEVGRMPWNCVTLRHPLQPASTSLSLLTIYNRLRTIFFVISAISAISSLIATANPNPNAPLIILIIGWVAAAIGLPIFFYVYQKVLDARGKK